MEKNYWVYILSNQSRKLYVGVTNDLQRRVYEHKNKMVEGFTSRYNLTRLVWFDETDSVDEAIAYEKKIKGWKRCKKLELIEKNNPEWEDLAEGWF